MGNEKEKTYPAGQYVAGESLELGDYLLKADSDVLGSIEMYEDYDHFVAGESFLYENFSGEYRIALRKKGVIVAICDATSGKVLS